MRKIIATALMLAASPAPSFAWGSAGHIMIGEVAARQFPAALPAFLRTPLAVKQIGLMATEPDIARNAGQPHDGDSDPGHFVDVSDDGSILGGPKLAALPATRRDYAASLRAVGTDEYKAGYLPYAVMDGWQQLVKDFALLRRDKAAQKYAKRFAMTPAEKKRYAQAEAVRQILTLRDLGVWAHYVGDASQPLHASVHYNGWGEGPNPEGFVVTQGLHAKFEADFVNANVTEADVAAAVPPYRDCGCTIQERVQSYLAATQAGTIPVYRLEKEGAFDAATPQAKAFTVARLAQGAAMLRDMVEDAWRAAGAASLGYKVTRSVADIEAGKVDPREMD